MPGIEGAALLEEELEIQAPSGDARPITIAEFQAWKQRKDEEEAAAAAAAAAKRREDILSGRARMTGKELYEHQPWVFDDAHIEAHTGQS